MLNGMFVLPQKLGRWQLALVVLNWGFPLALHREFLFRGFCGHNGPVAVDRVALYWRLTVFGSLFKQYISLMCCMVVFD
jgi:hypothetical protein